MLLHAIKPAKTMRYDDEGAFSRDEGASHMSITVNILYHGKGEAARAFAREMAESGTVDAIRAEDGNEEYRYFAPLDDPETVLLVDRWRDQEAIDAHHASPMMRRIAELRERHDLHMEVRRYADLDDSGADDAFIRR